LYCQINQIYQQYICYLKIRIREKPFSEFVNFAFFFVSQKVKMGNATSYFWNTTETPKWALPRSIKVKSLLDDDKEAVEYFGWCLANHGYALFENDTYRFEKQIETGI
jgi:hypothetical protein